MALTSRHVCLLNLWIGLGGRKSYPTQNVLVVVNFDLHFTYVLAGWEGSAHDSLMLQDALSRLNGLKIPEGIHGF
jgi:hypothetical protein